MRTGSTGGRDGSVACHQGLWSLRSDMRAVIISLIALLLLGSASISASAQVPVVGWLWIASPEQDARHLDAFRQGLKDLGHEEGRTVVIEQRWARGDNARLPALARDLLEHRPAVIYSACGATLRAIRELSRSVPVVAGCADPGHFLGEVASLRRPGGLTTGFTMLSPESAGKRLQLLKELRPDLSRVAVLFRVGEGEDWEHSWQEMGRVAPQLGLTLLKTPIARPEDIEGAVAAAVRQRAGALVVFPDATTIGAAERIAALAVKHRLLTGFDLGLFVRAGGLFSYGPDLLDVVRRAAAGYVDKILKGAAPGDLPIYQPTLFQLWVNLRTARALGLSVPQSLLVRADRVFE